MWRYFQEKYLRSELLLKYKLINFMALGSIIACTLSGILSFFYIIDFRALLGVMITDLFLIIIFYYVNHFEKYELGAIIICAGVMFLLMPYMYFTGGGIDSGIPHWYVLGILLTFLFFEGKTFYIFLGLEILELIGVIMFSYFFPQWVVPFTDKSDSYFDIGQSALIVALVIGVIFKFQINLYIKAQKEAVEARKEAEEASAAKSNFLANISHEIRTPMNAICGMADLLVDGNFTAEEKEYIYTIKSSSQNLIRIINDILDFSKIESGKIGINQESYHFNILISEVISFIQFRIGNQSIVINTEIDANIPSIFIGDQGRIRQILINILNNAVKFTERGSITLAVHFKLIDTNKGMLYFKITDTGIGILEKDLQKLFTAFGQVDTKRNRNVEGTGLGLVICKGLLEQMGGSIAIKSEYGKGTVITFELPQSIESITPHYNNQRTSSNDNGYKKFIIDFIAPTAKVAVVDDNNVNLKVANELMKKFGFNSISFHNGYEILEELHKGTQFDIIFIDHMMPGMDGIETTQKIRLMDNPYLKEVPIIALTANAIKGVEKDFLEAGMNDFLFKPIEMKLLSEILKKWLINIKILEPQD